MHIGQTLIFGFEGTTPQDKDVQELASLVEQGRVGGIIFFRHNIESPDQIRELTSYFRKRKASNPLFLAIDEEGGEVQRLKGAGFPDFLSPQEIARSFTPEQAYEYYQEMASHLKSFHFNLNLAPVVDLDPTQGPANAILGGKGRTFGSDPYLVSAYASAHIQAHNELGIHTALKHFPGHGRVYGDTHTHAVDATHIWTDEELIPYKELGKRGSLVMIAHIHHALLTQGEPGPFSSYLVETLLRGTLGFPGVVVTDDLFMGAANPSSLGESACKAINAGCDLLIVSYHPLLRKLIKGFIPTYEEIIETVEKAYRKGEPFSAFADRALNRLAQLR